MEEHGPFRVGHDAASGEVAKPITRAAGVKPCPPLAMLKHFQGFFKGIKAANSEVSPVEPVHPRALIALVGNEAHTNLGDGDRQGIVDNTRPVASLDDAIEKDATMDPLDLIKACIPDAGVGRGIWPCPETGKEFLAALASNAVFLSDCVLNLRLKALIEGSEIFPGLPGVEVQRLTQWLTKGFHKFVCLDSC